MSHRETRLRKARNWTAKDYLRWYASVKGNPYFGKARGSSLNVAADYLSVMSLHEKKILFLSVSDIAYDVSRDRKRRLAEEQLFDGEELTNW